MSTATSRCGWSPPGIGAGGLCGPGTGGHGLLDRGRFFVEPGEEIYGGQVLGEHTRERDLNINICKTKKLTNVRAAGSDEKVVLPPAIKFSLEEALEYIQDDELVEITPHHMRLRKILLDPLERKRKSDSEDCL